MNRAQRRAAVHRRPQYDNVINLPPLIDEWTVFDCPDRILKKVASGEIESIQGVPVFLDNVGEWCQVCPALSGWIFTWQKIIQELHIDYSMAPLGKIHNKLQANMPCTQQDITEALATLDGLRMVFRSVDRKKIKQIAQDAQIAIFLEDKRQSI